MQEHTTTHPEAVIPSDELTQIDDAADLADAAEGIDEQTAENIIWLVEKRESNRADDRTDIIVTFEDWGYEDWSDIDISESPVVLAGRVEDHSEDAWWARGAFYVNWDLIEGRPQAEVEDEWVTDLVEQVDETDKDFIDRIAATYWPKKAVSGFYTVE